MWSSSQQASGMSGRMLEVMYSRIACTETQSFHSKQAKKSNRAKTFFFFLAIGCSWMLLEFHGISAVDWMPSSCEARVAFEGLEPGSPDSRASAAPWALAGGPKMQLAAVKLLAD